MGVVVSARQELLWDRSGGRKNFEISLAQSNAPPTPPLFSCLSTRLFISFPTPVAATERKLNQRTQEWKTQPGARCRAGEQC